MKKFTTRSTTYIFVAGFTIDNPDALLRVDTYRGTIDDVHNPNKF